MKLKRTTRKNHNKNNKKSGRKILGGVIYGRSDNLKITEDDVQLVVNEIKVGWNYSFSSIFQWNNKTSEEIIERILFGLKKHNVFETVIKHSRLINFNTRYLLGYITLTLQDLPRSENIIRYGDECLICTSPMNSSDEIVEVIHRYSDFEHIFHRACIESWRLMSDTCPICRDYIKDLSKIPSSSSLLGPILGEGTHDLSKFQ